MTKEQLPFGAETIAISIGLFLYDFVLGGGLEITAFSLFFVGIFAILLSGLFNEIRTIWKNKSWRNKEAKA